MKYNKLKITEFFERFQELKQAHSDEEIIDIIEREYMSTLTTPEEILSDISLQISRTIKEILSDVDDYEARAELKNAGLIIGTPAGVVANDIYMIDGEALNKLLINEVVARHIIKLPAEYQQDARDLITSSLLEHPEVYMHEDKKMLPTRRYSLQPVKTYGIMKDALSRSIVEAIPEIEESNGQLKFKFQADHSRKGEPAIFSYATLQYNIDNNDDYTSITGHKLIDLFDHAVCGAIASIYHFNEVHRGGSSEDALIITPREIWAVMNGNLSHNSRPTAEQTKRIIQSFEKMAGIRIRLDLTEEIQKKRISLDDSLISSAKVTESYVDGKGIEFKTENGKLSYGFIVREKPSIYRYNELKNNLLLVDPALLDTRATTVNNKNTIPFKMYLLTRIELMYKGSLDSNKILFSSVYAGTGVKTPTERINRSNYKSENAIKSNIRKQTKNDRDLITSLLDAWSKMEYISGYELAPDGVIVKLSEAELERKKQQRRSRKQLRG